MVTDNAVERFVGNELKPVARAAQFNGLRGVPVSGLELGSADADGAGDLYISASGIGYSLYELTRTGHARFVSPFRGANGKPAPLSIGPGGVVYGECRTRSSKLTVLGSRSFRDFRVAPCPTTTVRSSPLSLLHPAGRGHRSTRTPTVATASLWTVRSSRSTRSTEYRRDELVRLIEAAP